MKTIHKSTKLDNVCYDIRGPVLERAHQMEEEGHKIIKLNIGNLAVFGFEGRPSCISCGSKKVKRDGTLFNNSGSSQKWRCMDCGKCMRGKGNKEDKTNLLRGA